MLARQIIKYLLIALLPVSQASLYINQSLSTLNQTSLVSNAGVNTTIYGDMFVDNMQSSLTNAFLDAVGGNGALNSRVFKPTLILVELTYGYEEGYFDLYTRRRSEYKNKLNKNINNEKQLIDHEKQLIDHEKQLIDHEKQLIVQREQLRDQREQLKDRKLELLQRRQTGQSITELQVIDKEISQLDKAITIQNMKVQEQNKKVQKQNKKVQEQNKKVQKLQIQYNEASNKLKDFITDVLSPEKQKEFLKEYYNIRSKKYKNYKDRYKHEQKLLRELDLLDE